MPDAIFTGSIFLAALAAIGAGLVGMVLATLADTGVRHHVEPWLIGLVAFVVVACGGAVILADR